MILPVDLDILPKPTLPPNAKEYLQNLLEHLRVTRDVARQNMERASHKSKLRYDAKAAVPNFQVADKVLLTNNVTPVGMSPKLTEKWNGPYVIVEALSNFTYRIKHCETGKQVPTLVNAQRLKHYTERLQAEPLEDSLPAEELPVDNSLATPDPVPKANA